MLIHSVLMTVVDHFQYVNFNIIRILEVRVLKYSISLSPNMYMGFVDLVTGCNVQLCRKMRHCLLVFPELRTAD